MLPCLTPMPPWRVHHHSAHLGLTLEENDTAISAVRMLQATLRVMPSSCLSGSHAAANVQAGTDLAPESALWLEEKGLAFTCAFGAAYAAVRNCESFMLMSSLCPACLSSALLQRFVRAD